MCIYLRSDNFSLGTRGCHQSEADCQFLRTGADGLHHNHGHGHDHRHNHQYHRHHHQSSGSSYCLLRTLAFAASALKNFRPIRTNVCFLSMSVVTSTKYISDKNCSTTIISHLERPSIKNVLAPAISWRGLCSSAYGSQKSRYILNKSKLWWECAR